MSDVPCDGCRACCRGLGRLLAVENPHPDLKTEWDPNWGWVVHQELNGDCIYITDEGCSIHGTDMFPKECAEFDCRDNLHTSVRPQEVWEARKRLPDGHPLKIDCVST